MPWAVAGAAVAAAGSIGSGILGADASESAAKTQAGAAEAATAAELQMYNQTVAREQPFLQAGTNALPALQKLLGLSPGGGGQASSPLLQMLGYGGPGGTGAGNINPATFQGAPGFQYQLQQGTNAVTNSAAANGGLGGNALRQLQQTGQGLANQGWQQYLGNFGGAYQNLVGNVSSLVAGGQNAAGNLGTVGTQVGSQIGSNLIGAGNALGAGQIGSANTISGGINGGIQNLLPLLMSLQSGGGGGGSGVGNLASTPNPFGGAASDASNPVTYGG